jgi:hypothetical protein
MTDMHPHHTEIEVMIKLGPTAIVVATEDVGVPVIEIRWGSISVVIMPRNVADDEPIATCDIERARDLHTATAAYLETLEALWDRQQSAATRAIDRITANDRDGAHD